MPRAIPWWAGGVLMSLLFFYSFSDWGAGRPIGASTGMAYLSTVLFGLDASSYRYTAEIERSGAWEGVMLIGAFAGGLFMSLFVTKTFRFSLMPSLWRQRKGPSVRRRLFWSFVGGFLLVFGARLAGGCNVGHVLSGGAQTALSGFLFTVLALGSGMLFGRFFYRRANDV